MKVITTIKMPQEEKDIIRKWLTNITSMGLPCDGIQCSGIACDDCPLEKICALRTDIVTATEELLARVELEEK